MLETQRCSEQVHVLTAWLAVPGVGLLPVNAFVVTGPEPYLVDTGVFAEARGFVQAVEALVDLEDLRWIYLTHTDPDHIGALMPLLERAPRARILTNLIGMAKLNLFFGLGPERFRLLNPDESFELDDRRLAVSKPPAFDAPETMMLHDEALDVLFSSDCFGAPLDLPVSAATDIPDELLRSRQHQWANLDAPWLQDVDRASFRRRVDEIARLDPGWVFSSHLPPAENLTARLCANEETAPDAPPFVGPTDEAFRILLSSPGVPASPAAPH